MYSTHNEGKSVVAEGFVRTLKNKIYKYTTFTSKDTIEQQYILKNNKNEG